MPSRTSSTPTGCGAARTRSPTPKTRASAPWPSSDADRIPLEDAKRALDIREQLATAGGQLIGGKIFQGDRAGGLPGRPLPPLPAAVGWREACPVGGGVPIVHVYLDGQEIAGESRRGAARRPRCRAQRWRRENYIGQFSAGHLQRARLPAAVPDLVAHGRDLGHAHSWRRQECDPVERPGRRPAQPPDPLHRGRAERALRQGRHAPARWCSRAAPARPSWSASTTRRRCWPRASFSPPWS